MRYANQRAFVGGFAADLEALGRQNANRLYGKFAADPRVKAALAWEAIPGETTLPPLPHLPALPPIGACPCLHCTMERAFQTAHDSDFAADLEAHGSAILFIELGGKPKS